MNADDDLNRRIAESLRETESTVERPGLTVFEARVRHHRLRRRAIVAVGSVLAVAAASVGVLAIADGGDGQLDAVTATEESDVPFEAPADLPDPGEILGPTCRDLSDPPPIIDGPLSTVPEVAAQQQARAGFGFASEEATVTAILQAGPPELSDEIEAVGEDLMLGLGVSLTADEVQDMYDRQLGPIRQASKDALNAFEAAHPDTFRGTWIDHPAGGIHRIAVTGDVDAQWAELEPTLPEGHRVEMEASQYSRLELEDFRSSVETIMDDFGLRGTAGISEQLGLVTLRLSDNAGLDTGALREALDGLPTCVQPAPEDGSDSAIAPGESIQPDETLGGFRTFAVFLATDAMGTLAVATTNEEVAGLWESAELGSPPGLSEGAELLLRFTIPDDACPEIFGGLSEQDGEFVIQMLDAGYGGCDQPLNPRTYIVSVDRLGNLPSDPGEATISLAPDDPFHDGTSVTLDLPQGPVSSGSPLRPDPEPEPLTDHRGTVTLPAPGTAGADLLDDGTPVIVVGHEDGTATVVDVRLPVEAGKVPYNDVEENVRTLTSWWGGAGRFLGGGVWDRYGRALDNGPHADLTRFETEVQGDTVVVGQVAEQRVPGDPIVAQQPFGPNVDPQLPPIISIEEAMATPVGTVSQIEAAAVMRSDIGSRICVVADAVPVGELDTCPDDSPVIEDLFFESPDGRLWTTWFHGPILVRRTADGFAEVVAMGGKSGRAR